MKNVRIASSLGSQVEKYTKLLYNTLLETKNKHFRFSAGLFTVFILLIIFGAGSVIFASSPPEIKFQRVQECNVDALKPVKYGAKGDAVTTLQNCFNFIGWDIKATGIYDKATKQKVVWFYNHFFDKKVSGEKIQKKALLKMIDLKKTGDEVLAKEIEVPDELVIPRNELVPIEIVISPEVSNRLAELGWNDEGAREVSKRARASTICLMKPEKNYCDGATGFVTTGGLIATCAHCTPHFHDDKTETTTDLFKFKVKTITGEILEAEVLEKSDIADLALVKVTSNISALPPPLLLEGRPTEGEPVIMVGHPGPTGKWVITLGKVGPVELSKEGKGWVRVDISGAAGNSGSPVLNKNSEVIGVFSHGRSVKDVPDIYPLDLTFHLTDVSPAFGTVTLSAAESSIILQDMIDRHQKEWIPLPDSKTYTYLERKASPLPKKSTQKSTAERLQELHWSENEARALAEKVRTSTICLRPPNDPTHCISSWVAAPNIIATCAHCMHRHGKDGDALVARTIFNATLSVELLEKSDKVDLALYKVTSNLSALPPPLALGGASVGDPVLMVGHNEFGNWVTVLGEIFLTKETGGSGYGADIAWFHGNSGSAVVNRKGEVIGVLTGGISAWKTNLASEPYQPHIILDIYKARTDIATLDDAVPFLSSMLEKY